MYTSVFLASMAIVSRSFPLHSHQAPFAINSKFSPPSRTEPSLSPRSVIIPQDDPMAVWFAPDEAALLDDESSTDGGDDIDAKDSSRPIVAAYYPDWTAAQLPPEKVDFTKIDWIDFAFAVPDPVKYTPKFSEPNSEHLLHRLVAAAHTKNKKVKLSIGGWTGSGHFSNAVRAESRDSFARDILDLYKKFNLDGIDIDWEYPGVQGAAGNTVSSADTSNFLAFLRLLRSLLPSGARITASTQVWPFVNSNGEHMKDVSPFAEALDWVVLMNYDVWGSSPTPGPNAPLGNACHNSSQPEANAHAAIANWSAARFPLRQIMLGHPAYGYVSRSIASNLKSRRRRPLSPNLDATSLSVEDVGSQALPGAVTVTSEEGSAESGQVQFRSLVAQGVLKRNSPGSSPAFTAAGGFERHWDACSSTPFLRSSRGKQVITYDDPESLRLKAAYAKEAGILGVSMWDVHGDTAEWDLIKSIRRGLGLE